MLHLTYRMFHNHSISINIQKRETTHSNRHDWWTGEKGFEGVVQGGSIYNTGVAWSYTGIANL